jgi:hypothetical protein
VTSLCPQNAELQRNLSSAAVLRRAQRHKARSSSCLSGASCSPRRRARRLPGPKQGRRPSSTRAPHATTPSSPATAPFEQPRATQRSTHRSADLAAAVAAAAGPAAAVHAATRLHGTHDLHGPAYNARPRARERVDLQGLLPARSHTHLSLSLSLSPLGGSFSLSAASAGVAISTPQALRAFAELAWRR